MTDMGLLVVAAESAHPGWGIAGNALGALIGGLFAALIAWRVAVHETDKQKAAAENARKDELRRSALLAFAGACAEMQQVLLRRDVVKAASEALNTDLRAAQVRIMLDSEGRADLLKWFRESWGAKMDELFDYHLKATQTHNRADSKIPAEETLEMSTALVHLEYVCLRWSTQPVEQWSVEPVDPNLIPGYSPRPEEKGDEPG